MQEKNTAHVALNATALKEGKNQAAEENAEKITLHQEENAITGEGQIRQSWYGKQATILKALLAHIGL